MLAIILVLLVTTVMFAYAIWALSSDNAPKGLTGPTLVMGLLIANLCLAGFVLSHREEAPRQAERGSGGGQAMQEMPAQLSERLDALLETTKGFREAIEQRDGEVKQLRDGYDRSILSRHYYRLIRLHEEAREILDENPDSKDIRYLYGMTEALLKECDISKVSPELGADARDLAGLVDDNMIREVSEDPSQHNKIAKVDAPAYVYDEKGVHQVVQPARITVYAATDGA